MVKDADPAQRRSTSPGYRRAIQKLGLAAALIPLGMHAAFAQSDPAFPPTAAIDPSAVGTQASPSTQGAAQGVAASALPSITLPQRLPASLLPFTGTNASGFSRANAVSSLAPPLERAPRNWSVIPSLGLGEEYNSNILATGVRGGGYDFLTLVQPSVSVTGVTTRLQGNFNYHPEVDIYARNFGDSHVNQDFGGDVLATLVPGTVFLDLRAFGGVTTNGAGGSSGTSTAANNNQTQSLAFAATPYALRRFGDWGTGEIGASLERSSSNAVSGTTTTTATNPFLTSGNQDLTSYSGHIGFATGDVFERYNGTVLIYASQDQGTGVLTNAARDTATLDNGYGITRLFTLLGRVGYEHIRYSGTSPLRIDDAIWDAGFRLTLGPESSVEARYGHHDGFNSLLVSAALQPTARTRFYVRFSEGLDTDAEQLQNALANSDFDQLGSPVDHTSGAPLLLATSGSFGAQNNLYRTQRLSIMGTLLKEVDLISASVNAETNRLVSSSGLLNSLGSNKAIFGSIAWSHELSPTLSLQSFGQYGVRTATQGAGVEGAGTQGAGTQHITTASIALVKALSETLSAQLRFSYNRVSGGQILNLQPSNGQNLSNYDQSLILLSATKSF